MSNFRYIEVDSTYRNRNLWPLAAEFEIPISQSERKNKINAVDPVCESSPQKTWIANSFSASTLNPSITITVLSVNPLQNATSTTVVLVSAPPGELQTEKNYYSYAVANQTGVQRFRIIEYVYLGNDRGEFRLEGVNTVAIGSTFTITDPTDLSSSVNPWFFIPDAYTIDNSYNGMILFNETRNEYRNVLDYLKDTHLLTVDTSKSNISTEFSGPVTSWLVTDTYSLRRAAVNMFGVLAGNTRSFTSFNLPTNKYSDLVGNYLEIKTTLSTADSTGSFTLGGTTIVALDLLANSFSDYFNGSMIRVTSGVASGQQSKITSYNGTTKAVTLSPGFSTTVAIGDSYTIQYPSEMRRIVKYVNTTGKAMATSTDTTYITLPTGIDYSQLYIQMTSGAANGDIRLINLNKGNIGYVSSPFSGIVSQNDTFEIHSGVVSPGFTMALSTQPFLILEFTYDNLNPFTYTGSIVSQQEMVCYEVELINLVLPNLTLSTGFGSRIAYYPYVYVELSTSNRLRNIIYSNNPNSSSSQFRCIVDDVTNPDTTAFVVLDGSGMKQTIKFKPNDNLFFSVKLSNGDLYDTVVEENYSPLPPNPLLQISACFAIKRL
jgi:hypothetical protein